MKSSSTTAFPAGHQLEGGVPPDQPLSQNSRFSESTWDMSSLIHMKNRSGARNRINFDYLLPDGSRLTDPPNAVLYLSTKEFCYWRLQGCPPIRPAKATSVYTDFYCLRILTFWMIANKKYLYSQLRRHHIEVQFLSFLRGSPENRKDAHKTYSDERIGRILNVTRRLWDFRKKMCDSLTFDPFIGKQITDVLGLKRTSGQENRTPVIPDEIIERLGNAALDYVYLHSEDILQARAEVESVRARLEAPNKYMCARGVRGNLLFNVTHTQKHASTALKNVSISTLPETGKPWREPFSKLLDLYVEETYLFTACYIVVAWLTGMRDSEITSLRVGCLRFEHSEDGIIKRVKIKGRLFKGVRDPQGREETWITIEPVARAIAVLTRLTQHLRIRTPNRTTEIFLRGERAAKVTVLSGDSISCRIRQFAEHIKLPLVDGNVWHITSRQFRRTLARWIARRPFGELAGMLQYKHVEIATFEGYAGRDSQFHKYLEEEKILANIDLLEELKHEAIAGTLAGPRGAELTEMFRGVAGDRRPNDEAYMLKHLARTLYVGMFNLCFYEPAYAMCQQHLPVQERKSPITSHCQPDKCANSCITRKHMGAYQSQLHEAKSLLKTPKLPIPQRVALEQEKDRIERIIKPLLSSSEQ